MTLLANAGIYLVLDVNSPKPGQSLNRYEPWSSYNPNYVNHILRVVHQFSGYNNTLGFFAGNEVVNDEISARESPHYLKAIVRDMHQYMANNSPRVVPVGYSAADDLRFRISLAKYMECGEPDIAVDFYGVNSYQWCGFQTFETSGYNILVSDYDDYSLPLFLSEYGCNAIMPRLFQEVEALYSDKMTNVFSGGLIYEFAQEPNNYGLVDIDEAGTAQLLADYVTLQSKYNMTDIAYDFGRDKEIVRPEKCKKYYSSINAANPLPECPLPDLVKNGIQNMRLGSYVDVKQNSTAFPILDVEKKEIPDKSILMTNYWREPMPAPAQWKENKLYSNIKPEPEPNGVVAKMRDGGVVEKSVAKNSGEPFSKEDLEREKKKIMGKGNATPSASASFGIRDFDNKTLRNMILASLVVSPIVIILVFHLGH